MPPTADEVLQVTQTAVSIFQGLGLSCCLFGSVASYIYGVARPPNDADIVVLTSVYSQEELKELLVGTDPTFYLVVSENLAAPYRVLWYRLSKSEYQIARPFEDCKVDILTPGTLNIPDVPLESVGLRQGLPVMPLIPQLLLKVQGWEDHRRSHRMDMRAKVPVDIKDVDSLVDVAVREKAKLGESGLQEWFSEEVALQLKRQVADFVETASRRGPHKWRRLGLGEREVVQSD
ncbi:uncharacterized protein BXZ73DRAFT_77033 [Epithele typhae]|uniref:uncharacterized protein n=1 Tax=Epithele typhae TaxID=378194 RepID=UPI002008962A|nr:uncharacterized protein BXZ73DRAFT_77033 [Epithele typhae]KAH9934561.1 hypothetical protein BXZ73DRAFT_77033 [Epithele typhae]